MAQLDRAFGIRFERIAADAAPARAAETRTEMNDYVSAPMAAILPMPGEILQGRL